MQHLFIDKGSPWFLEIHGICGRRRMKDASGWLLLFLSWELPAATSWVSHQPIYNIWILILVREKGLRNETIALALLLFFSIIFFLGGGFWRVAVITRIWLLSNRFTLHFPSTIYVWIHDMCSDLLEKNMIILNLTNSNRC